MIQPERFYQALAHEDITFYAGVPDSLLKNLCAYITDHADPRNNIIAANEGGAVGLAAGYHLATGKTPAVYMQNSGEGNVVNPLMSLTDRDVYHMPVLLIIGWRGEPGVHDEPQHVKQGKVTLPLLDAMGIEHAILSSDEEEAAAQVGHAAERMRATGEAYALVIRKGTFADYKLQTTVADESALTREQAIQMVAGSMDDRAVVVSTTGKISRELFEYRAAEHQGHERDFLTVGSMGHASQIALGIALHQEDRPVYCFDGDGAVIMHMGALAISGSMAPDNFYHILFNNGVHDSVGGQPTVGYRIDLPEIAAACGYKTVLSVDNADDLSEVLDNLTDNEAPLFLEIKVKKGARADLGRPTTTPEENKRALMDFLRH
ncbi:MAG TPA: phosphonopyruvate decarboxylase [Prevotella sp.]|nr:phosphonopyruvate decarboxylase [Prevotella sp.]